MPFTLTYPGQLKPRQRVSNVANRGELRGCFSSQLAERFGWVMDDTDLPVVEVQGRQYMPVIRRNLGIAVALDMILLAPKQLLRVGDTDNRAKAVIDALTLPGPQQGHPGDSTDTSQPTFCLLEDDSLVSELSVSARPWYGRPPGAHDGLALVTVTVVTDGRITITGIGFLG
ncbi:hypothetical protein [Dermacoccus sp. SAI-028]|uniref:hypothetical protein n=1 Tax=Dermacoccus sp. SAI-028 TaxID=2768432 RepID=UPI001044591F|nr:hypothetical protein [Dermacoccus sp. SAI-028]